MRFRVERARSGARWIVRDYFGTSGNHNSFHAQKDDIAASFLRVEWADEWAALMNGTQKQPLNKMETKMLEEKIDNLIAALDRNTAAHEASAKAGRTLATKPDEKPKTAKKSEAKTKTKAKTEKSEKAETSDDAAVSKTDVKNKLLDVQDKLGADTAKDILREHAKDGKAVFSALSEDAYAAVIADCDAALKKAA